MAEKSKRLIAARKDRYHLLLAEMSELLETARHASARAVNSMMTATYWHIGKRIVEAEQEGKGRAEYGQTLIKRLGIDLTSRFGRGFSGRNLYQMRSFYTSYSNISQTLSAKSLAPQILPSASASFPLPWSHYVRLLSVEDLEARRFYETEALRGGWTIRQLNRQILTMFYERTAMSRNKAAMLTRHNRQRADDLVTAHEEVKDPFVLEFLDLKDEYSESEVEDALIHHLETFLLELGGDFTFIGRQRRLRVGDTWYRIDLLFFHRRLRCLVIIDLKTGEFTHADAGQMHLYCNYAKEHWTLPEENPPVGLVLCAAKDAAVAHYALEGLPNKILAAQYKTALPDEKLIAREIAKTRRMLDTLPMADLQKRTRQRRN